MKCDLAGRPVDASLLLLLDEIYRRRRRRGYARALRDRQHRPVY